LRSRSFVDCAHGDGFTDVFTRSDNKERTRAGMPCQCNDLVAGLNVHTAPFG
jgi:hypothetical protein